ncbi:MAG: hypothetical protein D3916_16830 [Candidatus Electrothrix sp. MAN1_4]|nr:hypothetical protein [Candidatus Electrothrix sp. MAN1_4]
MGSMKGIYNYAGYLADGKPYVIFLNQRRNQRRTILARLKKGQYPGSGKYVIKKRGGKVKKGK